MWKDSTIVIDRTQLPKSRRILMDRTLSHFDIPCIGVVLVLEKEDYQEYPNSVWRNMAMHLNIEVGGIEEASPDHLLKLMNSCRYSHLIWLSRQACKAPDVHFAWILGHELRHLQQDLYSPRLSKAGHFLDCTLSRIEIEEPEVQNTIPTELDANLQAYRLTQQMFGNGVVNDHVQNEFDAKNRKELLKMLERCEHGKRYDVFRSTVALLRKYRSQFKKFQNRSADKSVAKFDIDRVCSKLSTCVPDHLPD